MADSTVTLRQSRDAMGSRFLGATLAPNGTLVIRGHDIGPGVELAFGESQTEYEWSWTLSADSVSALAKSLGSEDVLGTLKVLFSGETAGGLKDYLDGQDIVYESWSRVGD